MSQEQLAQRIDLSRTSMTNIEAGRQQILCHQLLKMFDALRVDDAWRATFWKALGAHRDGRERDYIRIFSKGVKA